MSHAPTSLMAITMLVMIYEGSLPGGLPRPSKGIGLLTTYETGMGALKALKGPEHEPRGHTRARWDDLAID